MKISAVCATSVSGGAERYLLRLYELLSLRGHDVELIGHVPGWQLRRRPLGLGAKWSFQNVFSAVSSMHRERGMVRELVEASSAPDVFHCQFKREQIGFSDILAKRAPVVWTEHGVLRSDWRGRFSSEAYRRAARNVGAIICVAESVRDALTSCLGDDGRVTVIDNAVDTRRLRPASHGEQLEARNALGIPEGVPVAVWAGRMHRDKLPMLAIRAARAFPGLLIMAGDGPETPAVRAATAHSRDRVIFVGRLPDTSVLYRAADALLFTSTGRGEGLPYVVLEAASHGLPIVANRGSGIAPWSAGIVLAADEELGNGLASVLSCGGSLGAANRAWVLAHHSEDMWLQAHENVFLDVSQSMR